MTRRDFRSRLIGVTAIAALASGALHAEDYDLIFAGGRVVDGTGAPWFKADVGVKGDRIAAVGDLANASAARRIDAKDLVVSPGFIDMMGQSEYNVLVDGRSASKITQGITTEVTGEGGSIAPLNARLMADSRDVYEHYGVTPNFTDFTGYFEEFARRGSSLNLATFVGAGQLRNLVIGKEDRPATPAELKTMEAEVAKAMEQGALGVSTSLIYVPDHFASTEEIIALAKVAAGYGGTYITHQRDEGDDGAGGIDASMDEFLRIVREAGIPGEIYHIKASGKANWGHMPAMLKKLAAARAQGLDVIADQYPWTASSNGLADSLPLWVREGGADKMTARLKNKATRRKIRADYLKSDAEWPDTASRILITGVLNADLRKYQGKTLADIGKEENKDPLDVMMDIVAADRGNTSRVTFSMSEDDVRAALRDPFVSFNTDSPAMAEDGIFAESKSHPRAWGSATRILGHYVRDEKVLSLEEAIRKMTSLPASRMRFADRGILRTGMAADLVAFNPATVRERATFEDPTHYSEGVPYVAVNGKLVVDGGKITEARPGIILKGPGYKASR